MSELATAATETQLLLSQYNFDLGGWDVARLIDCWLQAYPAAWLKSAAIEALYQGRYKAVSVEQILTVWQRRSRPLPHFSSDFERMICSKIPMPTSLEPPLKLLPDAHADQPHGLERPIATDTIAPYHPPNIDSGKLARLNAPRLLAIVERMAAAPIDRFVPDPTPPDFYAKLRAVAQQPLLDDSEAAS